MVLNQADVEPVLVWEVKQALDAIVDADYDEPDVVRFHHKSGSFSLIWRTDDE